MTTLAEEQIYITASSRVFEEQLPDDVGWVNRYALGRLTCAEAMIEGPDSAITMAHDRIAQFALQPSDSFGVWADLLKHGLPQVLPHARRAAGIAGEDVTFLEAIGAVKLNGLHSAERLVELVKAGDKESVPLARGMAQNTWAIDRTALLADLYIAGDNKSLDLAISSAAEAKEYCDTTGDTHYHRSERALYDMGMHAARSKNHTDVEIIVSHLGDRDNAGYIFTQLYKEGFTEYLPRVSEIINSADNQFTKEGLTRALAAAGSPDAINVLEKISLPRKMPRIGANDDLTRSLQNLLVLHEQGNGKASERVRQLVERAAHPEYYVTFLGAVGLKDVEVQMTEAIFERDPQTYSAFAVVYADFSVERWQRAFDIAMKDRRDPIGRSSELKYLAHTIAA